MPKDNFGNDSRFNEGVGNKKPLKKLVDSNIPNINQFSIESNKDGVKVNKSNEPPTKVGQDTNLLSDTPEKIGQDINSLSDTPQKLGIDVESSIDTPEKTGQDINLSSDTPEKTGQDINIPSDTSEKLGIDISPLSNLNKLENMGKAFNLFLTQNLSDVEDISPVLDNDLIKPFRKSNFSGLDDFSPIFDNDKIGEVDFFDNTNAPGFVKNFEGPSKYIEDSSDRDLPSDSKFTILNKYEDNINSNPDGNFSNIQEQFMGQSSNPLPSDHLDNIGEIGQGVSQEVDYFGGNNSYFPTLNPAIVGFTQMFTGGDGSLLITNNGISSLDDLLPYRTFNFSDDTDPTNPELLYENYRYDPRTPRFGVPTVTDWSSYAGTSNKNIYLGSALDDLPDNTYKPGTQYPDVNTNFVFDEDGDNILDKIFNSRNYDFRQERNIFNQLPGEGGALGSSGQRIVKFYNEPNSYLGTALDDLLSFQLSPLVGGLQDYILLSKYIGSTTGAPYINLDEMAIPNEGDPTALYDTYNYDPRSSRQALFNLSFGQTMIPMYNPQNPYQGSIFDDPLIEGLEGGGVFNNSSDLMYAPSAGVYGASPPSPSMKEIAQHGNFENSAPGLNAGILSLMEALNAINKYEETSLLSFPLTEFGTNLSGYYMGPTSPGGYITGEGGINFESIDLGNSSFWNAGTISEGIPVTNANLEASLIDDIPSTGDTRTVSINGVDLTSDRLGFDDLTFDTLYDTSGGHPIGILDKRLDIRYTTLSGDRGYEPYVVSNIGSGTSSHLFDTIGFGAPTGGFTKSWKISDMISDLFTIEQNPVFSPDRQDRATTDLKRFEEYFSTLHGQVFLERHEWNFAKNPRSYRGFTKSAISNSIVGKFGYYTNVKNLIELDVYTGTVYESLLRPFGINLPFGLSHPNEISNAILWVTNNLRQVGVDFPYLGGIAFQTLGLNKYGLTDKTNVAPTSLETLMWDNISNAAILAIGSIPMFGQTALQTDAGGQSEFTNPRYLGYTQKIGNWIGGENTGTDILTGRSWSSTDLNRLSHLKPGRVGRSRNESTYYHQEKIGRFKFDRFNDDRGALKLKKYKDIPNEIKDGLEPLTGADRSGFLNFDASGHYTNKLERGEEGYVQGSMNPKNFKGLGDINQFGDFMNLIPIKKGKKLTDAYGIDHMIVSETQNSGYPFYFKDLRDDSYIYFRGYIYGLVEQITPRWAEEVFLGRSEPVFKYETTTRDITFTLKIAAQTRQELDVLYQKLDKLASLCYPQYKVDEINFPTSLSVNGAWGKVRPKAPLAKLRIADLFGERDNELTGYIKSLSNVYPDENQWETSFGRRVPLYIESIITFQVIHKKLPDYTTKFYGKRSASGKMFLKDPFGERQDSAWDTPAN